MKLALRSVVSLAAAATASLGGCMTGAGYSTTDRVELAAREYHDGVRWGDLDKAARHVAKADRPRFLERLQALGEDLSFADLELLGLEVDRSDKKHQKVYARVEYVWVLRQVGLMQKTTTKQTWEEGEGGWVLKHEERIRGAPLSLFSEPKREPAPPADSAATAEAISAP